jgi:cell wall-associated protease
MRCFSLSALIALFSLSGLAHSAPPTSSQNSVEAILLKIRKGKDHKGEPLRNRIQKRNRLTSDAELWHKLDPKQDGVEGTSTERLIRHPRFPAPSSEIIVAVIDTGVDIHHPVFRGKLWVNEVEANGKPGVDDDGDGFVDDVNGWNFLGKVTGENVFHSTLEITRTVQRLGMKNPDSLTAQEKENLAKARKEVVFRRNIAHQEINEANAKLEAIDLLKKAGMVEETAEELEKVASDTPEIKAAKDLIRPLYEQYLFSGLIRSLAEFSIIEYEYHYNIQFDVSNFMDETGNSDVVGPYPAHGTHVAGIIASLSDSVRIMPIRAIPDGDERDEDVARAIRFAVDHGAKIINMSFVKNESRDPGLVNEALRHASRHGVLLVHAAGNSGVDLDANAMSFPNRRFDESLDWIEVGASGKNRNETLAAEFSNYGKHSVDLFAPGVDIISAVPNDAFAKKSGTSMAAPQVSGVAALLWSRRPDSTAGDIRKAMIRSARQFPGLNVNRPGLPAEIRVPFDSISVTGGLLDAVGAMTILKHRTR